MCFLLKIFFPCAFILVLVLPLFWHCSLFHLVFSALLFLIFICEVLPIVLHISNVFSNSCCFYLFLNMDLPSSMLPTLSIWHLCPASLRSTWQISRGTASHLGTLLTVTLLFGCTVVSAAGFNTNLTLILAIASGQLVNAGFFRIWRGYRKRLGFSPIKRYGFFLIGSHSGNGLHFYNVLLFHILPRARNNKYCSVSKAKVDLSSAKPQFPEWVRKKSWDDEWRESFIVKLVLEHLDLKQNLLEVGGPKLKGGTELEFTLEWW